MAAVTAILKTYFLLLLLKRRPIDMKLGKKHPGDVDKKWLKLFRWKIQDGRYCRHFENLFFASSPETKGQLKLDKKHRSDL